MEFFFEMLLTAVLALLLSFLVAKLVSVDTAGSSGGGGGNDLSSDQAEKPEIGVGDGFVTEEVRFGMKMEASVLESESNSRVVDQNVELVDRFESEADRVDEVEEAATGNAKSCDHHEDESVVLTAEAESKAAVVSPENNVMAEEMIVRGQDEQSDLAGSMVRTTEAKFTASISPENVVAEEIMLQGQQEERSESTELGRSACVVENEESGGDDVVVAESEEVRIEESNTVEESDTEEDNEEKEELIIEEDDDWEGIERSELEKAFAAAAILLEDSGKAEEIGAEAKMELFGLHKIATEGPCREAQPMAVMVSARAKWNAWQKLGNMSQEEAMEQYLALVSKEIPGLINAGYTVGKMSQMETSVGLPPNLETTVVDESSKNGIALRVMISLCQRFLASFLPAPNYLFLFSNCKRTRLRNSFRGEVNPVLKQAMLEGGSLGKQRQIYSFAYKYFSVRLVQLGLSRVYA